MLRIKNVSALEKVLPAMDNNAPEFNEYSCLLGERFSYQVAFMGDSDWYVTERVNITVLSDIKEYVKIYEAGCVPVITTAYPTVYDNGYISRQSSVIPDVLTPSDGTTTVSTLCYKAIWITVDVPKDAVCGEHTITVKFDSPVGISAESTFRLNVIGAVLPKQTMPFTQWFHADCISSYYGVKPLSEEHWLYIEKFIKIAAENGINITYFLIRQIMWQMFGYIENMSCSPQAAAASIAVLYIAFEHNYKTKTFLKVFGLIAM